MITYPSILLWILLFFFFFFLEYEQRDKKGLALLFLCWHSTRLDQVRRTSPRYRRKLPPSLCQSDVRRTANKLQMSACKMRLLLECKLANQIQTYSVLPHIRKSHATKGIENHLPITHSLRFSYVLLNESKLDCSQFSYFLVGLSGSRAYRVRAAILVDLTFIQDGRP